MREKKWKDTGQTRVMKRHSMWEVGGALVPDTGG